MMFLALRRDEDEDENDGRAARSSDMLHTALPGVSRVSGTWRTGTTLSFAINERSRYTADLPLRLTDAGLGNRDASEHDEKRSRRRSLRKKTTGQQSRRDLRLNMMSIR